MGLTAMQAGPQKRDLTVSQEHGWLGRQGALLTLPRYRSILSGMVTLFNKIVVSYSKAEFPQWLGNTPKGPLCLRCLV